MSAKPEQIRDGWLVLAIFAISFVTFWPVNTFEFLNYDDSVYLTNNPTVSAGLTWRGVTAAATTPHARNWHPLTTLSHMLDCEVFGMNAGAHHLMNVALHAAAAAMLFLALNAMTRRQWCSAIVAVLFAVHPLRVESVAWVSERKDVLSAFFFAATLWAYSRYAPRPALARYLVVVAATALGLFAKSMLVTLPIVLLLLDYWPLQRARNTSFGKLFIEKLPLVALAAACGAITYVVQKNAPGVMRPAPLLERIGNALSSVAVYVAQLFRPAKLSPFYPRHVSTLSVMSGAAVVIIITAFAWGCRRRLPSVTAGWGWFLVMLLPVIGIIEIGLQSHADRYTYLPHIGLLIALVWSAATVIERFHIPQRVTTGVVAVLLLACGIVTRSTLAAWHDSESLWTHALGVTKNNAVPHNNLGLVRLKQGRLDEAAAEFHQALDIARSSPRDTLTRAFAHTNLAVVFSQRGDLSNARDEADRAVQEQPYYPDAHFNFATVLMQLGEADRAILEYRHAAELSPRDAEARTNLGNALLRAGRSREATDEYRSALNIAPDSVATLNNLAWVLATSPDLAVRNAADAIRFADDAVRLTDGSNPIMLRTAAAARAEGGDFAGAEEFARRAMSAATAQGSAPLVRQLERDLAGYREHVPLRDAD